MALESVGVSLTFSSGFLATLVDPDGPDLKRQPDIRTTNQASTEETFIPSKLAEKGGEFSGKLQFDPDLTPPISGAAEAFTITWPIPEGKTAGATWAWSKAWLTKFKVTGALGSLLMADFTVKLSGAPIITAST